MKKKISVLRYGHRTVRDDRVTTHCCLVARAFGAEEIIIIGNFDKKIYEGMKKVVENWGGNFSVRFEESWKKVVKEYRKRGYKVVHLTMYGVPIQSIIKKLRKIEKILVIIGSQKVEIDVYKESDYNVAITKQPHSEIAALAVFLDWYLEGKEMEIKYENAKISIEGVKKVVK